MMKEVDRPPQGVTEIIIKNSQEYFNMAVVTGGQSSGDVPASESTEHRQSLAGQEEQGAGAAAGPSSFSKLSLNPLQKTLAGRKRKGVGRTPFGPGSSLAVVEDSDFVEDTEREQDAKISKSRITHRSCPADIVKTIDILSPEQKEEIRKLGWGKFLEFNLQALEARDLYCWLMEKLDLNTMELRVPTRKVLPITERVVNVVLGVPMGEDNVPHHTSAEVTAASSELRAALGIQGRKISINRLQQELREHRVDALSMRCFFLIVFNKLLFPTTCSDVSAQDIRLTMDTELMGQINWCRAVVQDLRDAAYAWQTRNRRSSHPSISGCAPLVVVYYLDNLDHPLNKVDRMLTPRCNLFSKKKIETITKADKYRGADGQQHYGLLELMSLVGACYLAPSYGHHEAADLPGRDVPTMQVPLMRDLLADVLNQPSVRRHKELSRIVHAMDTEVQAKVMEIQRAHQAIVESQHRHAAEIRKLIIGGGTLSAADDGENVEAHAAVEPEVPVGGIEEVTHQSEDPGQAPPEHELQRREDAIRGNEEESHGCEVPAEATAEQDLERREVNEGTLQGGGSPGDNNSELLVDTTVATIEEIVPTRSNEPDDFVFIPPGTDFDLAPAPVPDSNVCARNDSTPPDNNGVHLLARNTDDIVDNVIANLSADANFNQYIQGDAAAPLEESTQAQGQTRRSYVRRGKTTLSSDSNPDVQSPGRQSPSLKSLSPIIEETHTVEDTMQDQHLYAADSSVAGVEAMLWQNYPNKKFKVHPVEKNKGDAAKKIQGVDDANILSPHLKRIVRTAAQYASPFKHGKVARPVPNKERALALRDMLCVDDSKFMKSDLMLFDIYPFTGEDIKTSFSDGADTDGYFLEAFIDCLSEDDRVHRPECYGYRIFLGPTVCSLINTEELNEGSTKEFIADNLVDRIREKLPDTDLALAKMIFLTMCHREHFSVYCINIIHNRIDVLDSLDYKACGTKWGDHHDKGLMKKLMGRLCDALQTVSKRSIKKIRNMRITPFKNLPVMKNPNDCAFFTMKFLEFYDGEEYVLRTDIVPEKSNEMRAEMLHYLLFHPMNKVSDQLPPEIECFRNHVLP